MISGARVISSYFQTAFLDYIGSAVTVVDTLLTDLEAKRQRLNDELTVFSDSIQVGEDFAL